MANVLKNPTYSNAKGYQGFPLRNSIQFSSCLGHLLPVWWHTLDPGDKVNINCVLKTRTNPLDSPAMVSINEHLDWFFVPYRNLYRLFEQIYTGVNDIHSSVFDPTEVTNIYPYTTLKEIFKKILDDSRKTDDFGYNRPAGTIRLLQALGYDVASVLDWNIPAMNDFEAINVARSLWSLCAYQAIYYSHYRLSDRQENVAPAYSLDQYYQNTSAITSTYLNENMLKLRYRPIQKDFFHGGFVSPLIGSGNIGMLGTFNNGDSYFASDFFRQYLMTGEDSSIINSDGTSTTTSPSSVDFGSTNLASLRQSFALEKLLEITRRTGKHIDEQILAHFGVKVPEGVSEEPIYIGSDDSEIQIGDVISTAGTDSDALGELAGKGYNHSNGHIGQFEAKCHGILMCIYSSDIPLHLASNCPI